MSAAKIASGVTFAIAVVAILAFGLAGTLLSAMATIFVVIGAFGLMGIKPSIWVLIVAAFIFLFRMDGNVILHSRVRKLEKALAEKGSVK